MKRTRNLVVAVLFSSGCGASEFRVTVPAGEWGGSDVDLQVSASSATATFKCGATGTVSQALTLDAAGRFQVMGTYESRLVLGGPHQAQYSGSISGSTMDLTVRLVDDGTLGPFSLEQGRQGTFSPCNY